MEKYLLPTFRLVVALGVTAALSHTSSTLINFFERSTDAELLLTFFAIALIFALSFSVFYIARGTPVPSFVVAIFFGMAAQPLLLPLVENRLILSALVGFGATLILFGGGLETKFESFRKLFAKIILLSFVGLGLTAILLSFGVYSLGQIIESPISITAAVLLGALLASTDPAAIIPVLKRLRFKNLEIKDMIVSESAVTDVTGTLLTVAFITLLGAGALQGGILENYASIFSATSAQLLLKQLIFGTAFGIIGYALLHALTRFKERHSREYEADSAFFLFIPVIIFTLALAFGGSGYLAAFVAGLLFKLSESLQETERFFNHTIDGFFKPTIFLMLGALVDLPALIEYAPLGLLAAALFMLVIRPIAVFVSLSPFLLFGKDKMDVKDVLFISFVRETGAIPAVLLVTIAALGLPGIDGLIPIGMWVILATLIIEPPLTPWVAEKLGVAKFIPEPSEDLAATAKSAVVLGSRGQSWRVRMPFVVDWAAKHHIPNLTLLLCLEYKYSEDKAKKIADDAVKSMEKLNQKLERHGKEPIKFEVVISEGMLQANIEHVSQSQDNVVAIFVGRRMLDYKLDEIKKLAVPLYFMR